MAWLSTTIRIPVDDILEISASITDFSDENADLFQQLLNALYHYQSSGEWQGKDMDEMIAQTQKNQKKYERALTSLAEMGKEMKEYANALSEEDQRLKNQILSV